MGSACNAARGAPFCAAAVLVLAGLAAGGTARAESLEKELLRQAPAVLKYLKGHGYRNVGVLKFRVKKGEEPATDRAGPLNSALADRLELALVLADDVRQPVGIIHDASAVAARLQGANHLTREGRWALFEGRYPLAWGKAEVTADAFLTGVARISPDLRTLDVGVMAFDKDGGRLESVVRFTAPADADSLAETGESFLVRGAFDAAKPGAAQAKVVQVAAQVKNEKEDFPLRDEAAPVELEIRYDGRKVPLEIREGKAEVPEPEEGQEVTFVLRRKDGGPEKYGVVLKVNGENTFYHQRRKDLLCAKWLLFPDDPPITIKGFQQPGGTAEAFKVLSRAESKGREINYGRDVGLITLTVFRELKTKPRPQPPTEEAEDLAVLNRGAFPKEKARNLAALQVQLREDPARGLIVEGNRVKSEVETVKFTPEPTPVMAAAIRYYRP